MLPSSQKAGLQKSVVSNTSLQNLSTLLHFYYKNYGDYWLQLMHPNPKISYCHVDAFLQQQDYKPDVGWARLTTVHHTPLKEMCNCVECHVDCGV